MIQPEWQRKAMEINRAAEFTQDWDWFAVDKSGNIGHFTSAGLRALPQSVKADGEALAQLAQYFIKDLRAKYECTVTEVAENYIPQPPNSGSRERFLASFIAMATKGIFSYNSEMARAENSGYYLVAKPLGQLKLNNIPSNVAALLQRTRAPLKFAESERILEMDTLLW